MSLAPSIKERRPWSIMQESTCHWNARATRDRATDAAGLVPAGALQIDECARDPIAADGTQAGAIEASGRREQSARDPAWLWSEGWQDDRADIRGTDRGTGGWPPASADNRQGAAGSASGAADRVRSFREADPQDGAIRQAGAAADVGAGGRPDRGAALCQRARRASPVQIVEAGRSPFRVDAEEVSIRRDRLHRPDQQDR